jgi:5-methylcytosine-specific restriction endonuclease McrA
MHAYCVGELHLSEDTAAKRIHAARTARKFPTIFEAVAEGRLHLCAVCLLAPYLTPENATELLRAATHRTKAQIKVLLAERFPQSEVMTLVQGIPAPTSGSDLPDFAAESMSRAGQHALAHVRVVPGGSKTTPIAADRYVWYLTVGESTQEKLQYAKELLSHQIPSGDIAQVLERALDELIASREKRRFGATRRPRMEQRASRASGRHIPAAVKRADRERDGGRCTFVGENGHRCGTRKLLEFDHIVPVARGGKATVADIRLRCRTHNHLHAVHAFGADFMAQKRKPAREKRPPQAALVRHRRPIAEDEAMRDVIAGLRNLGVPADLARRAAESCESRPHATLEDRFRAALAFVRPQANHRPAPSCTETRT